MTIKYEVKVTCPACGHEQVVEIYQTINVTLDPRLLIDLCAQKINRSKCVSCGESMVLDVPLLYHDMKGEFCIQYIPISEQFLSEELSKFASRGTLRPLKELKLDEENYMYRPHVVFSMEEMVNYINFRIWISGNSSDPIVMHADSKTPNR